MLKLLTLVYYLFISPSFAAEITGKVVKVDVSGKDRYGRSIGTVCSGKVNVNHSMVAQGLAWQYLKYDKSKVLRDAQATAKAAKLGIWSQGVAIPPWDFRAAKKKPDVPRVKDNAGFPLVKLKVNRQSRIS